MELLIRRIAWERRPACATVDELRCPKPSLHPDHPRHEWHGVAKTAIGFAECQDRARCTMHVDSLGFMGEM